MSIEEKFQGQIQKLESKYQAMGQDLSSYLDGLLHANYLQYWDYIHLETLLSLQTPKTDLPDEMVFITYHQITELYFKLVLSELKQIAEKPKPEESWLIARINRVIQYWDNLIYSFGIMVNGMEAEQFMKFRMSLLPASGFQSVQYRLIEIYSTPLINLVDKDDRSRFNEETDLITLFEHLYWKKGATELATGKKTLTLQQFEKKYTSRLLRAAQEYKDKNLASKLENSVLSDELRTALLQYDEKVNKEWSFIHLRGAARYLDRKPDIIAATGGTNWQQYLPPNNQMKTFFPFLLETNQAK